MYLLKTPINKFLKFKKLKKKKKKKKTNCLNMHKIFIDDSEEYARSNFGVLHILQKKVHFIIKKKKKKKNCPD